MGTRINSQGEVEFDQASSSTHLCYWGHGKLEGQARSNIILKVVVLVLCKCFVLKGRGAAISGNERVHFENGQEVGESGWPSEM